MTAFLRKGKIRRNEDMQRYTAHATSKGSLRETRYFYEQAMHSPDEVGMTMPALAGMRPFWE